MAKSQTHRFSRCRGGYRSDLQTYFRSSWEANYARYLNHFNIKWAYESTTFKLGQGVTYTPDFKLGDNTYVEIKGWLTEKGKKKLNLFKLQYPGVKLILIRRQEYKELYNEYSETIKLWEKIRT